MKDRLPAWLAQAYLEKQEHFDLSRVVLKYVPDDAVVIDSDADGDQDADMAPATAKESVRGSAHSQLIDRILERFAVRNILIARMMVCACD